MEPLENLKRIAAPAIEQVQLILIANASCSPQNARRFALKLGWSSHLSKSTEALSAIYFSYGKKEYLRFIHSIAPDLSDDLCFCGCHHSSRHYSESCRCGNDWNCGFENGDWPCLCPCHQCEECSSTSNGICNIYDIKGADNYESDDLCDCSCHASCEDCDHWHNQDDDEDNDENSDTDYYTNYNSSSDADEEEDDDGTNEDIVYPTIVVDETGESPDNDTDPLSEKVNRVITKVGGSIGKQFDVEIVENINGDDRQACASSDGKIYITRKAAEELDTNELAFVLSHEVAHFEHDDLSRSREADERLDQVRKDSFRKLRELTDQMKADGDGFIKRAGVKIVGSVAITGGTILAAQAHSRALETEADDEAIQITKKAGYDPRSASDALKKLHGGYTPDTGFIEDITSTHPSPKSRKRRLDDKADGG